MVNGFDAFVRTATQDDAETNLSSDRDRSLILPCSYLYHDQ
jgi:hypothetical protein